MKITKDDFEAWRTSPITQAFLLVIATMANTAKEQWSTASWNNERLWRDNAAAELRAACRARAECAEDILHFRFEEEEEDDAARYSAERIQGIG